MQLLTFQQRQIIPEKMDEPALDANTHRCALAGLARLNLASRAAHNIAHPILALARREHLTHLTLLDVACGGGDVPVRVAAILQRAGITTHLTLTDRSPTALAAAQEKAVRAAIPARCLPGEAPDHLINETFDVVTNSLFLHHLTALQIASTLIALKERARKLLVVSDLRRSALGYLIAQTSCRLLSRSPIVHFDGPASVLAAWSIPELKNFTTHAGMENARLQKSWPWRMLLTWQPPNAEAAT